MNSINSNLSKISLISPDDSNLLRDSHAKTISFFCKTRPVKIDNDTLLELREVSKKNNDANVRVCLHDSPLSLHHDMVILERKGKYYRPHKHKDKGEAFHIIDGKMAIFVFDHAGNVIDSTVLVRGDVYRIEKNQYHSVMPVTNIVIYHENKPGPFLGSDDSIFPNWAPNESDHDSIKKYVDTLTVCILKDLN